MKKLFSILIFLLIFLLIKSCNDNDNITLPKQESAILLENSNMSHSLGMGCVTAPDSMVSWWTGDGTAEDFLNNNNGIIYGNTTFTDGFVDSAFSFDGSGDYVEIINSSSLQINGAISVDCWVFPLEHYASIIVGSCDSGFEGAGWQIPYYGINLPPEIDPQHVVFTVKTSKTTYNNISSPANSVPLNTWTHIAATSDGIVMKLYINGIEVISAPSLPVIPTYFSTVIAAHQRYGVKEQYYKGLIDEIEVFNRVLTAAEIWDIFDAGQYGICKYLTIEIDIKPGSYPDTINVNSMGVIPVAIITTENFDATTVDPLSVEFGPNNATECHNKGHIMDVDSDGDFDMVLHFRTQETGINCGMKSVSLKGYTTDGDKIAGEDSIRTVPCK